MIYYLLFPIFLRNDFIVNRVDKKQRLKQESGKCMFKKWARASAICDVKTCNITVY